MPKYIYEKDFFSVEENRFGKLNQPSQKLLPQTPWMSVQFRSSASENPSGDIWTEVAHRVRNWNNYNDYGAVLQKSDDGFDLNTYVESITIEDNGGMQKCRLTLFDPDFVRLENLIIKSYLSVRSLNELSSKLNEEVDVAYLQYTIKKTSAVNFRVRIGYSEQSKANNIDETNPKEQAWLDRIKLNNEESPGICIRSPWMYFQILSLQTESSRRGVRFVLEGVTTSQGWLENVKIIKRNAIVKGTPENVIKNIAELTYEASLTNVAILNKDGEVIADNISTEAAQAVLNTVQESVKNFKSEIPTEVKVQDPDNDTGETLKEIQIDLGGSPAPKRDNNGKIIGWRREYVNLSYIFNQIANKTPPKYKNIKTGKEESTQEVIDGEFGEETSSVLRAIPYRWTSIEVDGKTFIIFRYVDQEERLKEQEYIRTYRYGFVHDSILLNFNINSKLDFAALNTPIAIKNNGGQMDLYVGSSPPSEDEEGEEGNNEVSATINGTSQFQDLLQSGKFGLVSNVKELYEESENSKVGAKTLADAFISELNQNIFEGSIELMGDPFYFFDAGMRPYEYGIRIEFLRPGQLKGFRDYSLASSYMSGIYLISKITHNIDRRGYRTSLELKRYPGKI